MTQQNSSGLDENQILEYIDVLERTASTSMAMLRHIEDKESQLLLARDVEVLLELRIRIWKQFTPVLVGVVN